MKTKTIKMFASDNWLKYIENNSLANLNRNKDEFFKHEIQITIPVPDRVVTITESDWDEAVKYADNNYEYLNKYVTTIKEKLFSKVD